MSGTYNWLREQTTRAPVVLAKWDGAPSIMLQELSTGAMLWWMFEDHNETSFGVFVHLTDREAQTVFEHAQSGDHNILEPVRATLVDPRAVVWSTTGTQSPKAAPFQILPYLEEEKFIRMLWDAAEATMEPVEESAQRAFKRAMAGC
ncbi:hypothetical protein [Nocardia xishanensis]